MEGLGFRDLGFRVWASGLIGSRVLSPKPRRTLSAKWRGLLLKWR